MKRIARRALVTASEILLASMPRRQHSVVSGWPSDEGNAVEVARELIRANIPFVWLDAPDSGRLASLGISPTSGVRFMPKRSLRGFASFVTARCVFVTHGLYGNPRPARGKIIVNLWHGDGPKREGHRGEGGRPTAPANFMVSSSAVFADYRAKELGTPSTGILLYGLPRQQQMLRPIQVTALESLGIDPRRPFVVWLPTYRVSTGTGLVAGWTDGSAYDLSDRFEDPLRELILAGIQVVVKKHPLDAVQVDIPGLITVSDRMIADVGATLYGLLGESSGLITDYSSVWVDYLVLDRPIAFLVPDEEQYIQSRGLFPSDVMQHLPGLKLDSIRSTQDFANEVKGLQPSSSIRQNARVFFGIVTCDQPSARLVEFLTNAGHLVNCGKGDQ